MDGRDVIACCLRPRNATAVRGVRYERTGVSNIRSENLQPFFAAGRIFNSKR
jgi:hypothetical protein